jgi:hypothetical protein
MITSPVQRVLAFAVTLIATSNTFDLLSRKLGILLLPEISNKNNDVAPTF